MKILDVEGRMIELRSIGVGRVFIWDNRLFIRSNFWDSIRNKITCVCLEDGYLVLLSPSTRVFERPKAVIIPGGIGE